MITMTDKKFNNMKLAALIAKNNFKTAHEHFLLENVENSKNISLLAGGDSATEKKLTKTATQGGLRATSINYNVKYDVDEITSGQYLLLQLNTTAGKKVVFHSVSNANISYQTTIFYIDENNNFNVVEQSTRVFDNYDVDSFIALGGIYYIQVEITSGTGDFSFLTVELSSYSSIEACDNLYDALGLTPSTSVSVTDFFDNRMDFDFYALTNSTPGQTVYLNFIYDNNNIINPYKYNPSVILTIFLLANNSLSIVSSDVIPKAMLDIPLTLNSVGTYYFALSPNDLLPIGQLEESYHFSVTTTKQNSTTLPSSSYTVSLGTIEGAISYGYFDTPMGAPFFVNGTAVHLNGTINNWNDTAKQVRVRVRDNYNSEPLYGMAYINSNGTFDAVIPLFKTTARINSFTYHNTTMDWNWIDFIDDNDNLMSISFAHRGDTWASPLKIGVYYNDFPLSR